MEQADVEMDEFELLLLMYFQSMTAGIAAVVHNTSIIAECMEKQTKVLEQMNRSMKR